MAQSTVYKPSDEQELMATLWSPMLANDLYAFVVYCFPWGEPNTPLHHRKGPRKWQRRTLLKLTRNIQSNEGALDPEALRLAIASGRGIGKSTLVSWLILWMMTTRIGSSVIVSANTENQLRTVTWGELTKWSTMIVNAHWWHVSATKLVPAQWLVDLVERDLKKGTRYWAAEGKLWSEENPDGYAGPHNEEGMMVIFDEASGIPDAIWSVASGFFTEKIPSRYWLAFSNPRRNTGYFFECFHGKRDYWSTEQIDARTVEETDQAIYQQIIDEYGEDSREAKVEVYGEFPSVGDDQFISPMLVDEAMKRPATPDPSAPIIVGVDPARGGMDSTVIVVRQGRSLLSIKRYRGDDTMTTVGRVIDTIEKYNPAMTVVDEGGLGYGVLDRLTEQNYKVRGVNFGWKPKNSQAHLNKRAEMWCAMAEWIKTASLPLDKALKNDLTGVKVKPTSTGVIQLEGKKEMKARGLASPDAADAVAVTFAFPIARREYSSAEPPQRVYADNRGSSFSNTGWMGH